jgi:hypothetical protein
MSGLGSDERDLLRQMVRQVLQEVVPQTMAAAPASSEETVSLATDAQLDAFVRRIAALCDDDDERERLRSGSRRFRLASAVPGAAAPAAAPAAPVVRVDKGAVTERHVREAAAQGADLVLGRGAVLTPLARDRARAADVRITKEK